MMMTSCFKSGASLALQFAVKARAVQTKKMLWRDDHNEYLFQRSNGNKGDSEDSQSSQETDSSQPSQEMDSSQEAKWQST